MYAIGFWRLQLTSLTNCTLDQCICILAFPDLLPLSCSRGAKQLMCTQKNDYHDQCINCAKRFFSRKQGYFFVFLEFAHRRLRIKYQLRIKDRASNINCASKTAHQKATAHQKLRIKKQLRIKSTRIKKLKPIYCPRIKLIH